MDKGLQKLIGTLDNDKREKVKRASRAFEKFTDNPVKKIDKVKKPNYDVAYELGKLVGVVYEADTIDGRATKYQHVFSKKSQPRLAVSHDGKQLIIIGGLYNVNERGIVDTK